MAIQDTVDEIEQIIVGQINPYPGARPFGQTDGEFFCGRDREALQLANMVATNSLTVLYGESGVGKSSLVNAKLREKLDEVEPDWLVINFRDWPVGCYGKLRAKISEETGVKVDNLANDLYKLARDNVQPILLSLDQFEEYFLYHPNNMDILGKVTDQTSENLDTMVAHARADANLEAELAKLANSRRGLVRVLLSLRNDGLFLLDRLRLRIPSIFANMMLLEPLDARGAEDAVRGPIKAYNDKFGTCIKAPGPHSELVGALVAGANETEIRRRLPNRGRGEVAEVPTIGSDRIVAPFLQLALHTLWNEDIFQHGKTELTLSSLRRHADIDEARDPRVAVGLLVQRHVNKTLDHYEGDEHTICAVLERMVLPSGRKVAIRADDFQNILKETEQPQVEKLLKELSADAEQRLRLLREFADADNQGRPHFEIMHDALATPILNWISRVREKERAERERAEVEQRLALERSKAEERLAAERGDAKRREELAIERAKAERQRVEAENRLALARAEAEKRVAAERAEAEKRVVAERAEAEKRLAVERAGAQARRRARRILAVVVSAFLLVMAVAGWHVALQSGINRLTQFAEVDSQPEFRLRLLASLAALDEARRFWPLTSGSGVLRVLQEKLTSSPRDGGTYSAFGLSADGTRIAFADENQLHIEVCSLIDTENCSSSSAAPALREPRWFPLKKPPFPVSASEKLRSGFNRFAVGFLGEDHEPVYYRGGNTLLSAPR